jgi:hypothetical protein
VLPPGLLRPGPLIRREGTEPCFLPSAKKKEADQRKRSPGVFKGKFSESASAMKEREQQFADFVEAYPAARRQRGYMAEQLFLLALDRVPFETIMAALEQHKRSEQWQQTPRFVPSMLTWLQQEHWIRVLPEAEQPPTRRTPFEQARHEGLKKW